jgi:hypothetical protein
MEQPRLGIWTAGVRPVSAMAVIAARSSRGAPGGGGSSRPLSSRPR